jgi:hypothetical protein
MDKSKNTKTIPESLVASVKSRFFAQYWGTKTLYIGGVGKVEVGKGGWNLKHPNFFLQLKPLSKITDDDVQELLPLVSFQFSSRYTDEQIKEEIKKSVLDTKMMPSELFDFLRSKGYALPYMNYSVDDLISFGWVQLL